MAYKIQMLLHNKTVETVPEKLVFHIPTVETVG